MNRFSFFIFSTIATLAVMPTGAEAQQKSLKEQLVGTWILVQSTGKRPDGSPSWGQNPSGAVLFDATGQYSQILVNPAVPKFKINNRLKGTPEENTAAVQGTTATFGTWMVDEASKTVTVRYVGGMFPNQAGTEAKRTVVVTGDELKINNPATASGMKSDSVYRRAK